jgi:hypothetical protein
MTDDTARAYAYPAGVAVRPASAVAAAAAVVAAVAAAVVVAAAAVLPSRPGAENGTVRRHTGRPGTARITGPSSPPKPWRGSKVNGSSDVGDLAPVTVLWGLTTVACTQQNRQNRSDHQNDHQVTPDYDEHRAHELRIRRFARAAYLENHAPARRFVEGFATARQASEVCEFVVLAVAWTLCDLAGRGSPSRDDVTTALSFRQAGGA